MREKQNEYTKHVIEYLNNYSCVCDIDTYDPSRNCSMSYPIKANFHVNIQMYLHSKLMKSINKSEMKYLSLSQYQQSLSDIFMYI